VPELSKGAGTVHVRKKSDETAKKKKTLLFLGSPFTFFVEL